MLYTIYIVVYCILTIMSFVVQEVFKGLVWTTQVVADHLREVFCHIEEAEANGALLVTVQHRLSHVFPSCSPHFPFVIPLLLSFHFPHRSTFFFIVLHHSVTFRNLPLLIHVHCIVTCHHMTFQKVPLRLVS